ncbi:MAG: glycosyltransferase, partial [Acidobacteriota bacterium]
TPSPARRLGRLAVAAARAGRRVAGRVWHSALPADLIVREPRDQEAPALSVALLLETEELEPEFPYGDRGGLAEFWERPLLEVMVRSRASGTIRALSARGAALAGGSHSDFASAAAASRADLVAWGSHLRGCGPKPPDLGLLETAAHLVAVEDLFFVHARMPDGSELFCARWGWTEVAGNDLRLATAKLEKAPKGKVLGRSLGLEGAAEPFAPPSAARYLRGSEGRWLASRHPPRPVRHPRSLAVGASRRSEASKESLAVVLTRPLGGGLDRVLRALPAEPPTLAIQLAGGASAPGAHSLLALGRTREAPSARTWPIADFFDPEDRSRALLQLLDRQHRGAVLHVGPGHGFLDAPELLGRAPKLLHLPAADPCRPGVHVAAAAPPDARSLQIPLGLGLGAELPLPERSAARRRLGIPGDALVMVHLGDLGLDERPEDLVALAAACLEREDLWLLLCGRGPLAGTVDDLALFAGVERIRRADADPAEALAAADMALSVAENSPLPWGLVSAAAHGLPVLAATRDRRLSRFEDAGRIVPAGALDALAEAILELAGSPAERLRLGQRGRRVAADLKDEAGQLEEALRDAASR